MDPTRSDSWMVFAAATTLAEMEGVDAEAAIIAEAAMVSCIILYRINSYDGAILFLVFEISFYESTVD